MHRLLHFFRVIGLFHRPLYALFYADCLADNLAHIGRANAYARMQALVTKRQSDKTQVLRNQV